jgi:nitroreductase
MGERLQVLKALIAKKFAENPNGEPLEFSSYPKGLWEPLRSRRFEAGKLRYEAFGFKNKDSFGLQELQRHNYRFFGAPVGLFFYLDRRVGSPQWADLGMFIMAVMLLAIEEGLDTCPQQLWGNWNATLATFLSVPADQMLFCGMSMGVRDEMHPCNARKTERASLSTFLSMHCDR